jgi:hypothetical protein
MKKQSWVDPDDGPPITGEEAGHPDVRWRIGGKEVSADEGRAVMRVALRKKTRVNIHLDSDVIAHYKAMAPEGGYQTLINAALRRDMEGDGLKAAILRELKERTDELRQQIRALEESLMRTYQSNQMQSVLGSGIDWETWERSNLEQPVRIGSAQSVGFNYNAASFSGHAFSGTKIEGNVLDNFLLICGDVIESGARLSTQFMATPSALEETTDEMPLPGQFVVKRHQHA